MRGLQKAKTIAESFLNKLPVEEQWYKDRLEICRTCPKNTDNMEDLSTDLRLKTKMLCPENRVCSACGCCIDRKAAVKSEVCGVVEVEEVPKWFPVEVKSKKDPNLVVENLRLGGYGMSLNDNAQYEVVCETKEPKIDFVFRFKRGGSIQVREVVKTCSCTSSNVVHNDDGTADVTFTISTRSFKQNKEVTKTVVVKYIVNNHPREIEFKAKITKR